VRRDRLREIGGFDPTFRVAGDDVDACWRLQEAGGRIGFHHAGLVWHHRRDQVVRYLKQQRGYGRAEALLERKWPQKYNDFGHMRWSGQLYGTGILRALRFAPSRIYHGCWGSAPFQSLYAPSPSFIGALVQMPEFYLLTALLFALSVVGWGYHPFAWAIPFFLLSTAAIGLQTFVTVREARFASAPRGWPRLRLQALTAALCLLQPIARLIGRVEFGLTPWRRTRQVPPRRARWTLSATEAIWSERWRDACDWLASVCDNLRDGGAEYAPGRDFDAWDVRIGSGVLGRASMLMVVEEHGGGKQLVRFRLRPHLSLSALVLLVGAVAGALLAPPFALVGALIGLWAYREITTAIEHGRRAIRRCEEQAPPTT
jgi:hypothetical protein